MLRRALQLGGVAGRGHYFFLFPFIFPFSLLLFYFFFLSLPPEIERIEVMAVNKITYEDALARFKRSLEVKRAAEKRIAEEWARRGITGTIVAL